LVNPIQSKKPQRIKIPSLTRFPLLDDVFYKELKDICVETGEVVWTSKICILIENTKAIPNSIILPISKSSKKIEIFLEYRSIFLQYSRCLELEHEIGNYSKY